jgi:succinyl-CoA synthetase beta subunit
MDINPLVPTEDGRLMALDASLFPTVAQHKKEA